MREKGFTLVEMLLALAVTIIIGVYFASILVNNSGFFYKQTAIINEGLSLNDAVSEIDKNIRQASSVAAGYPEASPTYTSGSETLVLKLPAFSDTGTISNTYDYVVVAKDAANPKVVRLLTFPDSQSIRPSTDLVLTTMLESITFSYLDKNNNPVTPSSAAVVSFEVKVSPKLGSIGGSSRTATMVTTLRNY